MQPITLYRYELYFFDEPQTIGFIQGLRDVGIPEQKIDELIAVFDKKLPIPPFDFEYDKSTVYAASYFTEKGRETFFPVIKGIQEHIESLENGFELVEDVMESNEFLYEDDYQVVLLKPIDNL